MKNIKLKSDREIKIMQEGGKKLSNILVDLVRFTRPGVTLLEIEKKAVQTIDKAGGYSSFKRIPGYHWATCINVNEGIVHGVPNEYQIKEGDVVTIDIGLYYKGFNTDMCWTKYIQGGKDKEQNSEEKKKFLNIGKKALVEAIKEARLGNRIGHISAKIQQIVEQAGYNCARSLTGHGVGKDLHEPPAIPCFLKGKIEETPMIKRGMALAIEVIYTAGKPDFLIDPKDNWTIKAKDGKITAVFEESVAIADKSLKLTKIPFLP